MVLELTEADKKKRRIRQAIKREKSLMNTARMDDKTREILNELAKRYNKKGI